MADAKVRIICNSVSPLMWGNNHPSPRIPNRIKPRHILIKFMKVKHKEQILKTAREKQQITDKEIPIRITADLSIETFRAEGNRRTCLK